MGLYPVKQLIIIRKDLGMNKGKLAAQAAHASMGALLSAFTDMTDDFHASDGDDFIRLYHSDNEVLNEWLDGSFAKIALAVNSEDELKACLELAKEHNLLYSYIVDNGTTVFNGVPTPTCVGIGPAKSEVLDVLFNHLKLY
jgi:PTH2 family peptidyl-tRNA hydrolase